MYKFEKVNVIIVNTKEEIMHQKFLLRLLFLLLTIATFILIFRFSSEGGEKSSSTSEKVVKKVINTFSYTQNLTETRKTKLINILQPITRKIAHFSIYTLVGIWIMSFISTYDITILKKLFFSIGVGLLYAISDEIHQGFIPGRSPEIRDVLIDTCGVTLGILIVVAIVSFFSVIKYEHKEIKEKRIDN